MKDSTLMGIIGIVFAVGIMSFITLMVYSVINPNKAYEIGTIIAVIFIMIFTIIIVNLLGKNTNDAKSLETTKENEK